MIKCPNFAFQGSLCINGTAIAVVCQIDENTLLNKTIIENTARYGMDLNDTYNVFSFNSDNTSMAISKFRFKFLVLHMILSPIAFIIYLVISTEKHKHNHSNLWHWNIEISISWFIVQLILLVIFCLASFGMRQIIVQKFAILKSNKMVLKGWNHFARQEILDTLAKVDAIIMNIEELIKLKAPELEKFINTCNELQIKLVLFDDTYNPDNYYRKMNLDIYGIVNGYKHMFIPAADILRKCNDSNGIIIRLFSKQRKMNIIKAVCDSGKTICQIGNRKVLILPGVWWKIEEKFVSILVGNKNANDIARNDAHVVCGLDARNGIMAAISAIQQLKQLQQRWYAKLKNKNCG